MECGRSFGAGLSRRNAVPDLQLTATRVKVSGKVLRGDFVATLRFYSAKLVGTEMAFLTGPVNDK